MSTLWKWLFIGILFVGTVTVLAQDVSEADDTPLIINNYASDDASLLIELETLGLIPSGAEALFGQSNLNFVGDTAQFSNFALENEASNLVMGAIIHFAPQADDLEFCGIASHAQRAERNRLEQGSNITSIRLNAYAATGIDSEGNIFAYEINDDERSELAIAELDMNLTEPVYLLLVVIDDMMTVFANGEAVISDYPLTLPAGAFAFLYAGMDAGSSCRAETVFAYTIADELVDSCHVSSDTVINRRSGPGTEFDRVEQLQGGEALEAVGHAIGTDGFVWWYLADETWVRDDVVDTKGFCRVLPEIEHEDV